MTRFVSVGSLNYDVILQSRRLPMRHEKVVASDMRLCPGGAAANTAYWLALDGMRVEMVGAVGADCFGERCIESLSLAGVIVDSIVVMGGSKTGLATVWSTPSDKRMITVPGPSIDEAIRRFDNSETLHAGDIVHVATRPSPALQEFCYRAVESGATLSVEFNGRSMDELRPLVTIGFMNADELKRVVGVDWRSITLEIVEAFLPAPDSQLVVTLGHRGALAVGRGGVVRVPTRAISVADRTGGGDAFDAGFLAEYARGGSQRAALGHGLEHASKVLRMIGARL